MAASCPACHLLAQSPGWRRGKSGAVSSPLRPTCSLPHLGSGGPNHVPGRPFRLPWRPNRSRCGQERLLEGRYPKAASADGSSMGRESEREREREREGEGGVRGGSSDVDNPASLLKESLGAALDSAMDSEESRELLRDLVAAEERVARAKAEMEEIERQEMQLQKLRKELELQNEADSRLAAAEEEVTKLLSSVSAAEEEVRLAGVQLLKARSGMGSGLSAERIESAKAGAAAGVAGALAYLPLALGRDFDSLAFGVVGVAVTCALFGVTFRYAVRQDSNNVHLKSGVVGAFALAQGLARVDASIVDRPNASVSLEDVAPSLLSSGEAALALLAAALCLEYCLQQGLVQRFPSE